MKKLLFILVFSLISGVTFGQTVTRTWATPTSVSVDGVGNYGSTQPAVSFTTADFSSGCIVNDVDVVINWAKTAGTCTAPTGACSQHQETSFRVNGPLGNQEILALPGTWSGCVSTTSVTTTFSDGSPAVPAGAPITGTFDPNNGNLSTYNGMNPSGNWTLSVGDNGAGAPVCLTYYSVVITTAPDVTAPTMATPADVVVSSTGQCQATVNFSAPTATDACGATVVQTVGPPSGASFPVGTTPITYVASDPYGNSTSVSFNVIVEDNQNPVISCPGTIFAGCNTTVNYPVPTATDNCPGVTVSLVSGPPSGGTFTAGTTAVTYEAVDASGNTASCTFDVVVDTESTAPTSITATSLNVCAGDPTTLTVNGGSLGTGAQWFWYIGSCGGQLIGAGPSITVNPLSTANYYVQAVGSCGATNCASIVIDVTGAPSVGFTGITSPSACGAADGTITVVASGGTAPYTYTWSNNSTGATISGLSAGPYEVTVVDANGCSDFSSVSINDPGASPVTLVSDDNDNIICAGDPVTFTASGAFQYQYYINGVPVSTQNPFVTTTLQDGDNVYVTGTDFNFCTFTTQGLGFTVYDNPEIAETITHPSACAATDGVITTSITGGLPPYTYLWSITETTPNISGLAAGPYLLTVTDNHGCNTNETYGLNDPGADPPTITLTSSEDPNNEICAGESITFTGSAGFTAYEFFVDAQSVSTTNPYTTNALVNGQSVVATGTDGSNCTVTSNVILPIVNPGPIVTLVSNALNNTICVGQSISFFASGALTYEFFVDGVSQGAPSPTTLFVSSSLTDGQEVTVVGTDGNQCDVESMAITVTVNPSPTVTITNILDPTECGASDGAITAEASGGTSPYTYTWSTGDVGPTVAFLNAGSYFVQAVDDAGCPGVASASLSDVGSSPVILTSTETDSTICGGESVTFTATGASTYIFYVNGVVASTTNPFVTDTLEDGDFIAVTGLDTMLCSATSAPVQFTVHPEINIGIVSSVNPSTCGAADGFANTITIGGVPAYTYLWSDGQTTPNAINLPAGQWAVEVTDANGCTSTDAVSLSDYGAPNVTLTPDPIGLVVCSDTEVEFTAYGAVTYEFFIDGNSVGTTNPYVSTILDGQTIAVVGTDANSCVATSPGLTYAVNQAPNVSLVLPSTTCSNEDVIQLSGGSPIGGFYTVDYNGFPIIGDLFFPDLAGPGSANVDYTYEDPATGCSVTISDDFVVFPEPEIDLGGDTTVCTLTLDAGAGFTSYQWTPTFETTPTIQVWSTDLYGVTVVDANGCIGEDEILVVVNPIPSPTIMPAGPIEFCAGEYEVLTAPSGYDTYDWSTGSDADTTFVTSSQIVTLTVTNEFGCTGEAEVEAIMHEPMAGAEITWDGPLEFCVGGSVNLNAGPGYASYLWNSGSTIQIINVIETGSYSVIVMDGNGCIDSSMVADPVEVTVWDPEPLIQEAGDVLTVTNSNEFVTYQWFFNGDPIPGATGSSYEIDPTGSGNYMVCVVDDDGCEGCSYNIEMTCCVGIEEANFDGDVSVYPNPNSGEFTVEIDLWQQRALSIGLYDMVGKQVWLDDAIGSTSQLRKQYDLSEMPDGVYFLRIYADEQMTVTKLIKQQ